MPRDPDGPHVLLNVYLMPEAADAMERLAAIARTRNVNIVNYALMAVDMLIDKGIIPVGVLVDGYAEKGEEDQS